METQSYEQGSPQRRIKNLQGLAEGVQIYIDSGKYKGTDAPHILLNQINVRIEKILNESAVGGDIQSLTHL